MMRQPRQSLEGSDAWRNGFSVNAADLLQIIRVFSTWTDADFKQALVLCARYSHGRQTNTRVVERVLREMQPMTEL